MQRLSDQYPLLGGLFLLLLSYCLATEPADSIYMSENLSTAVLWSIICASTFIVFMTYIGSSVLHLMDMTRPDSRRFYLVSIESVLALIVLSVTHAMGITDEGLCVTPLYVACFGWAELSFIRAVATWGALIPPRV